MPIQIRRIYEESKRTDGYRVLIDRLWPRGMTKEAAQIDRWAKGVSPSTELRKWYSHDPDKYAEFKKKYLAELDENQDAIDALLQDWKESRKKTLTLLTSTKEMELSHANVLSEILSTRP
jgi:uncharacterized protein YeaO (DUF488 family)